MREREPDEANDRAEVREVREGGELPRVHRSDPLTHYDYNAWDVCKLPGVRSIEMWRVIKRQRGPVTCLACVAMTR